MASEKIEYKLGKVEYADETNPATIRLYEELVGKHIAMEMKKGGRASFSANTQR